MFITTGLRLITIGLLGKLQNISVIWQKFAHRSGKLFTHNEHGDMPGLLGSASFLLFW